MFKLTLTWYMKFFNDFLWFSMTFPGKKPFFQVNIKFNDFSSEGLNSMTFPGLCEPWIDGYMVLQGQFSIMTGNGLVLDLTVDTFQGQWKPTGKWWPTFVTW